MRWQRAWAAVMVAVWFGVLAAHPLAHLRQAARAGAAEAQAAAGPALVGLVAAAEVCPVWQVQQLPGQAGPAPVQGDVTRPLPLPAAPRYAPRPGTTPRRLARAPPV